MTRWVPDSLFGRILITLIGGVILTAAITLLVQLTDREAFVFRTSAEPAARRVADLVKLLDRLPTPQRMALADIAKEQGVNVDLLVTAPVNAPPELQDTDTLVMHTLLRDYLGPQRAIAVAQVRRSTEASPSTSPALHGESFAFTVLARLEDGTWGRFTLEESRRFPRWPTRVVQNLGVMLIVIALLSFLVVRWVTRPLKQLAQAAEELGRNISHPPLPEHGPQEVRRAARAFNTMQERLVRYVRTRTAILAAMSHDLKTPITRLRLRAELLEEHVLRDKFLRDLDEMQRMVGTTLNYMHGLDDRERVCPIDVTAMLEAICADAEEVGHAVSLTGTAASPFLGKPLGFRRILQNLLDNARHYAGAAEVVVEDQEQRLVIVVRDRGPGIASELLEHVFEPFHRVENSRSVHTGGTGLGLSIARNLAQSMGGNVTLAQRDGGGLEARLVLPRNPDGFKREPVVESLADSTTAHSRA